MLERRQHAFPTPHQAQYPPARPQGSKQSCPACARDSFSLGWDQGCLSDRLPVNRWARAAKTKVESCSPSSACRIKRAVPGVKSKPVVRQGLHFQDRRRPSAPQAAAWLRAAKAFASGKLYFSPSGTGAARDCCCRRGRVSGCAHGHAAVWRIWLPCCCTNGFFVCKSSTLSAATSNPSASSTSSSLQAVPPAHGSASTGSPAAARHSNSTSSSISCKRCGRSQSASMWTAMLTAHEEPLL
mmetsp:Transcript_135603/g.377665  ORF Transcript_135603/g.377665 Transcript_135603/m.377665 type:complete len:241 (+) Transcript_135603:982-1704(+)